MRSWEEPELTLWEAVRRIIARTEPDGAETAALVPKWTPSFDAELYFASAEIVSPSLRWAMAATVRPPLLRAMAHMRSWCTENRIEGHGVPGRDAAVCLIPALEWRRRDIDFEKSRLIDRDLGRPPIWDVTVKGADIDRLCEEVAGSGAVSAPVYERLTDLKPSPLVDDLPSKPAVQTEILQFAQELWPDGKMPARVNDRNKSLDQLFRSKGQTPPHPRTYQRAFADNAGQ